VIVLGIDPGTAALGYGLVERTGSRLRVIDAGTLETPSTDALPQRLLVIHRTVVDLIELHRPALVAVERLFFSKNAQTAFAVGQARGVVLLAAAESGLPVREATPNEVKTAVTGYGAADKGQVGRMVAVLLGLAEPPRPDDTADALAIAIWASNSEREVGAGTTQPTGVLDRSAIAPITRGESPYDRAVREALAAEKAPATARNRR
jgi:crossover junction endodeoxyribonuclease RuvC